MRTWTISARGRPALRVSARNWLVALGRGVEALGHVEQIARLACEVLPNGTVIARDVESGVGYVVTAVDDDDGAPLEEEAVAELLSELPPDAIRELPPDEDVGFRVLRAATVLQACQVALSMARQAVQAESGAVLLRERGGLWFAAVHGPLAVRLTGTRVPLGVGVAGYAMEQLRSVILADAHADPRHWGVIDAAVGHTTRELAAVPLLHGEGAMGVLEVMNTGGGRVLQETDLDVLHPIADALALRLAR